MTLRLKALRSLRWNYTRKGVWFWLKGRQRLRYNAAGQLEEVRGWQRVLTEPEKVIAEQTAAAEGVFV